MERTDETLVSLEDGSAINMVVYSYQFVCIVLTNSILLLVGSPLFSFECMGNIHCWNCRSITKHEHFLMNSTFYPSRAARFFLAWHKNQLCDRIARGRSKAQLTLPILDNIFHKIVRNNC